MRKGGRQLYGAIYADSVDRLCNIYVALRMLYTQLVSIWFVLGSVCAAITTIFTSDITIQSAVFLVVSLVSLIVTRPLVKRFKKRNKITGTNAERHIGQVGFILSDLLKIENNQYLLI